MNNRLKSLFADSIDGFLAVIRLATNGKSLPVGTYNSDNVVFLEVANHTYNAHR